MIVIAGLAILFAAVLCVRLLWSLGIHAFPLWSGGMLAWWTFHARNGPALSALAGPGGAITALALVELLSRSRSPLLRLAGIALFAVPAALVGYFTARGLTVAMIDDGIAAQLLSFATAVLVAGAAAIHCLKPGNNGTRGETLSSSRG